MRTEISHCLMLWAGLRSKVENSGCDGQSQVMKMLPEARHVKSC